MRNANRNDPILTRYGCFKTKRSPYVMYPYLISVYGLGIGECTELH